MAIPKNISKEHLLNAIEKIDKEGVPLNADSQYYDVIYKGKHYPPKLVVSYANFFANGIELDRNSFEGGTGTASFKLLETHGFEIKRKGINYYLVGANWNEDLNPDQSDRFLNEGIWENGYYDKFLDVVKSVKVGDRVAMKSTFATRGGKSILRIKGMGTVVNNQGDGRILQINWDKNFTPFDLEGIGGYRSTIHLVAENDVDIIFAIVPRGDYFSELIKFISQASTGDLRSSTYLREFLNTRVKVSFGQGNPAAIPWIAFLKGSDTVQNGIYPVYLFYKDLNLLVLSYGVSETYNSVRNWNIVNLKTIEDYFLESGWPPPIRYRKSYVYKVYDLKQELNQAIVNKDLSDLIAIYNKTFNDFEIKAENKLMFDFNQFNKSGVEAGLLLNKTICLRFCASMLTKPFVILTGLSGSGKTKVAQSFVQWICQNKSQYLIIPVGADWTNREPLLGYPNALNSKEYVKPESGVLDLIIQANDHPDLPHFLILDEMNLSHVERYFADLLSVMESKEEISLHSNDKIENGVPPKLKVPSNLFIIGTVNIDETTYMFSPKVLDRANIIEFRVDESEMKVFLGNIKEINMDALVGEGSGMAASFLEMAASKEFDNGVAINDVLIKFFNELKKVGAEFGYRTATEILRLIHNLSVLDNNLTTEEKLDIAIIQKLLPKLHGSRNKLSSVLEVLGSLCISGNDVKVKDVLMDSNFNGINVLYPISFEKIARMYRGAVQNGYASYAEA